MGAGDLPRDIRAARALETVLHVVLADRERDLTAAQVRRARAWAVAAVVVHGVLVALSAGLLSWAGTYPWPGALPVGMAGASGTVGGSVGLVLGLVAWRHARSRAPSAVTGILAVGIGVVGVAGTSLHLWLLLS